MKKILMGLMLMCSCNSTVPKYHFGDQVSIKLPEFYSKVCEPKGVIEVFDTNELFGISDIRYLVSGVECKIGNTTSYRQFIISEKDIKLLE